MDEAYTQHSHRSRHQKRSTTNLNRLSLAPLTTKLPLDDDEVYVSALSDYPPPPHTTSYIQGRSAPTTPGLFSRAPTLPHPRSRSSHRISLPDAQLLKSKSASNLAASENRRRDRKAVSGTSSPVYTRRRKGDEPPNDDGDWLLRAGVMMSTEAREYKGQAWLTSRESSTSLAGMRDAEDDLLARELAREREFVIRNGSRRGSVTDMGGAEVYRSARGSRQGSRSASRVGSQSKLLTPLDVRQLDEGYFGRDAVADDSVQGPDFVNLDEELEAIEKDTSLEDEAAVRKLVRGERAGAGSWFGWSLFSVEENQEDSELEDDEWDGEVDQLHARRRCSVRHFEGVTNCPNEPMPPPNPDEGGWQDAAWLLSVATKVIL